MKRMNNLMNPALCEKYPNMEFFLVRMRENMDQKKLRIWIFFTQCSVYSLHTVYINSLVFR